MSGSFDRVVDSPLVVPLVLGRLVQDEWLAVAPRMSCGCTEQEEWNVAQRLSGRGKVHDEWLDVDPRMSCGCSVQDEWNVAPRMSCGCSVQDEWLDVAPRMSCCCSVHVVRSNQTPL
eukprot:245127_1